MILEKLCKGVLFGLGLCTLISCANQVEQQSYEQDKRHQLAVNFESSGNYQDAMTQWKILRLIYSNPPQVEQQIERLSLKVSILTETLHKKASTSTELNRNEQKRLYLTILSFNPNDVLALQELTRLTRVRAIDHSAKRIERVVKKEPEESLEQDIKQRKFKAFIDAMILLRTNNQHHVILEMTDKFLLKNPENEQALKFQFTSLISLAEAQLVEQNYKEAINIFERALSVNGMNSIETENRLQRIKNELSTKFYRKGIKLFTSDLSKAIDMFTKSLKYNSKNANARLKLTQAKKIQDNLRKIKQQSN